MSLMRATKLLMQGARPLRPQDVFATSLYTGNGGTQTITNGLDLAGKGGLLWRKARTQTFGHGLSDTVRGSQVELISNSTAAESSTGTNALAFNADGWTQNSSGINGQPYVGWSFRRAKKFFDIVTYTGNGQSGRQIPHGLGDVPGMIVVKARSATGDWAVWHRGKGSVSNSAEGWKSGFRLNGTEDAAVSGNGTPHSSSTFDPAFVAATGAFAGMNANGVQYVAYLFAHNPDLIQCGSYNGNGSVTGPVVTCGSGWRPQFLISRRIDNTGSWYVYDDARSPSNPRSRYLLTNSSNAENSARGLEFNFLDVGFQPAGDSFGINSPDGSYIYLAIRSPT